jgi:hypothetical protein
LKPTHFASELYILLSRKKVVYIVFSAAIGFICTENAVMKTRSMKGRKKKESGKLE